MNTKHNKLSSTLTALGLWLCALAWAPKAVASPAINPGTPWPPRTITLISLPSGPTQRLGPGLIIDPAYVKKHRAVTAW